MFAEIQDNYSRKSKFNLLSLLVFQKGEVL